jgi:hypothetical protein
LPKASGLGGPMPPCISEPLIPRRAAVIIEDESVTWRERIGSHKCRASTSKELPTNYAVDNNSPLPGLPGHGLCQRMSGGLHLRIRGRR